MATVSWLYADGHSTDASAASTSFSRTPCGRDGVADPKPGREDLGERAEVDDALGVVGAQRARDDAVEAEQPVGVVLEHEQSGRLSDGEHGLAARRCPAVTPAGLWKLGTV